MGTKKRDLEIVYNLVWKNRAQNADDKSNIIGMYDIPSTTLNWDTFKSYLLKNSGCNSDDVKVSYIDSDDKEIPIDSQNDFHLALYSFRKRARVGEIITLTLARHKKLPIKNISMCYDFGVQCDGKDPQTPPIWFTKYMKKFKKEVIDEITISMKSVNNKENSASHHSRRSKPDLHKRARKHQLLLVEPNVEKEVSKALKLERRLENKLEKLESKTLKVKSKKLLLGSFRVSSDSDVGRVTIRSRAIGLPKSDDDSMGVTSVSPHDATILHIAGGETYTQEWEVMNTGKAPWTNETFLRYAWGSEFLKPKEKKVACPNLSPGQTGFVAVTLEIPEIPGNYECYWHFHHLGKRFGNWLGCQVIADEPVIKSQVYINRNEQQTNSVLIKQAEPTFKKQKIDEDDTYYNIFEANLNELKLKKSVDEQNSSKIDDVIANMGDLKMTDHFAPTRRRRAFKIISRNDSNSSDTDNASIVSMNGSSVAQSDEFVVIPMPANDESIIGVSQATHTSQTSQVTQMSQQSLEIDADQLGVSNDTNNNSEGEPTIVEVGAKLGEAPNNEAINVENAEDDSMEYNFKDAESGSDEGTDFAFIVYNGTKYPFHKKYLREDYFETAEKVPLVAICSSPTPIETKEDCVSVVSSAAECCDEEEQSEEAKPSTSCNSASSSGNRLFVFPQHSPGFEVVYPTTDQVDGQREELDTSADATLQQFVSSHTTYANEDGPNRAKDITDHINKVESWKNNYQYTKLCAENQKKSRIDLANYSQQFPQYMQPAAQPPMLPNARDCYQNIPLQAVRDGLRNCNTAILAQSVWQSSHDVILTHLVAGCVFNHCTLTNAMQCLTLRHDARNPSKDHFSSVCETLGQCSISEPHNCITLLLTKYKAIYIHPIAAATAAPQHMYYADYVNVPYEPQVELPIITEEDHLNHCDGDRCVFHGDVCVVRMQRAQFEEDVRIAREMEAEVLEQKRQQGVGEGARRNRVGLVGDNLLAGAAIFASSAMSTARNVINKMAPNPEDGGKWVKGHWVSDNSNTKREKALKYLNDMGFVNRDLNATLLARYNDDVHRVITDLIQ